MLETTARLLHEREKLSSGNLTKERESRLLHDRHRLDPSRLRPRDISAPNLVSEGRSHSYSDRSRPDGEVSEKLHADKYSKSAAVAPDRRMHNDVLQERRAPSYRDTNSRSRDSYEDRDKYKHISDWERDAQVTNYTSGASISSKGKCYMYNNHQYHYYLTVI